MLVLNVLGRWLIGSLTLGPLLAWVFFYPIRRQEEHHASASLCEGLDTVICLGTTHLGRQLTRSNPNGRRTLSCKQGKRNEPIAFGMETLRG